MNAGDIRAEAAERLALFDHSRLYPGMPWESVREGDRQWLLEEALDRVDALGDLLPTGVDQQDGWTDRTPRGDITHIEPTRRRYVTEWRTLEER